MACCIFSSRINHFDDSQKYFLAEIRVLSAILVLGLTVGQQNGGWEWRSSALSAVGGATAVRFIIDRAMSLRRSSRLAIDGVTVKRLHVSRSVSNSCVMTRYLHPQNRSH
jgi:hypothetical protein